MDCVIVVELVTIPPIHQVLLMFAASEGKHENKAPTEQTVLGSCRGASGDLGNTEPQNQAEPFSTKIARASRLRPSVCGGFWFGSFICTL